VEITIKIVNQFGNNTVVPVCDTAKLLAQLANTKTLSPMSITLIKKLGYTVNVEQTLPKTL